MKVRIKFKKYGPIRFIGHLDVMRFFQKAMRRAEIDIAYTTGFSPHQIMSFAAPLGVGLESNGEYMDIECHSVTGSLDMMNRLNRVSAPGIEVISVKSLPDHAGNAMASVAAAGYTVRFRDGREPEFDFSAKLHEFLANEHIMISKETKNGVKEVDIRPGIYEMRIVNEIPDCQAAPDSASGNCSAAPAIYMLVDASSAGNLKPGKVIESFLAANGEELKENALLITREDVYTNIGNEKESKLVPLDEIGSDIPQTGARDASPS